MNRSLHEMGVKYDPRFEPPKPVKRMRPQRNVGSEVLPTKRKKVVPVEEVGSSSKSSQSETVTSQKFTKLNHQIVPVEEVGSSFQNFFIVELI